MYQRASDLSPFFVAPVASPPGRAPASLRRCEKAGLSSRERIVTPIRRQFAGRWSATPLAGRRGLGRTWPCVCYGAASADRVADDHATRELR